MVSVAKSSNYITTTYGKIGDVLCSLKVAKGTRSTRMYHALEILRSIEGLLFLE
jgi:hypothetical protein